MSRCETMRGCKKLCLKSQVQFQFWLSCLGPWSDVPADVKFSSLSGSCLGLGQVRSTRAETIHSAGQQGLEVIVRGCSRRWGGAGGRAVIIGWTCGGRHRWRPSEVEGVDGSTWIRLSLSIFICSAGQQMVELKVRRARTVCPASGFSLNSSHDS